MSSSVRGISVPHRNQCYYPSAVHTRKMRRGSSLLRVKRSVTVRIGGVPRQQCRPVDWTCWPSKNEACTSHVWRVSGIRPHRLCQKSQAGVMSVTACGRVSQYLFPTVASICRIQTNLMDDMSTKQLLWLAPAQSLSDLVWKRMYRRHLRPRRIRTAAAMSLLAASCLHPVPITRRMCNLGS